MSDQNRISPHNIKQKHDKNKENIIRELLVHKSKIKLSKKNHRNCMADSNENY